MRIGATLLFACALAFAGARAEAEAETAEPTDALEPLTGASLDERVHRSSRVWAVLVTAAEGCPQCESMQSLVESAARMSKGLANFGVIDVLDADNAKALALGPTSQVPELRLYVDTGIPNAYKKSEFYRAFTPYAGQPSARGIKKAIYDAVLQDAPTEDLVAGGWKAWASKVEAAKAGVVAVSSKSATTALVAGLARALNGRAPVAQVLKFDPETHKDIAAGLGGLTAAPALLAYDPASAAWQAFPADKLSKAELAEVLAFVGEQCGLDNLETVAGTARASSGSKPAPDAAAGSGAGVLSTYDTYVEAVRRLKMPVVLAVRTAASGGEAPADWDKFRDKAHGTSAHIVYCDTVDPEAEPKLFEEVCAAESAADEPWVFRLFAFDGSRSAGTTRTSTVVKSLSQAKTDAMASMPEVVMPLTPGVFQNFAGMAVQSNQLPVVLFGKQKDPPAMLIALAAALQGLALVGYRGNPDPSELAELGLPAEMTPPLLLAMIAEPGDKPGETRMMLSMYDRLNYGKFSYLSMLSYAFQVAGSSLPEKTRTWIEEHGSQLGISFRDPEGDSGAASGGASPGGATAAGNIDTSLSFDDASVAIPKVDSVARWAELCPDKAESGQMMCVIGVYDGDALNSQLDSQLAVLQAAREKLLATPAGGARLRFVWVDGTCHQEFLGQFELEPAGLPGVVVYHPKKRAAFKMVASYEATKVEKFLTSVVSGFGKGIIQLDAEPTFDEIDCDALRAPDVAEIVDDDDEDDLLAEIRAEEAREARERKEALKREMEELERQKKAAKEAEEAASKKRRRRRRRRKPSSSEKDEL